MEDTEDIDDDFSPGERACIDTGLAIGFAPPEVYEVLNARGRPVSRETMDRAWAWVLQPDSVAEDAWMTMGYRLGAEMARRRDELVMKALRGDK